MEGSSRAAAIAPTRARAAPRPLRERGLSLASPRSLRAVASRALSDGARARARRSRALALSRSLALSLQRCAEAGGNRAQWARAEALARDRLRAAYRFAWNLPFTREVLARCSHLMLGGERDVYPNFTQALELSAEIGGEFACTLLSLARGAVWEYQRQLWDEADRVQRGLLGAERALAARQVDAVFRARALAERRDFERALQASVLRLKAAQKGTSKLGAEAAAEEAKLAAGAAGDEDDGAPPEPKPKDQYSGAIATVEARLEKTRAHILAIEGAIAAAEAEPEGGEGGAGAGGAALPCPPSVSAMRFISL